MPGECGKPEVSALQSMDAPHIFAASRSCVWVTFNSAGKPRVLMILGFLNFWTVEQYGTKGALLAFWHPFLRHWMLPWI